MMAASSLVFAEALQTLLGNACHIDIACTIDASEWVHPPLRFDHAESRHRSAVAGDRGCVLWLKRPLESPAWTSRSGWPATAGRAATMVGQLAPIRRRRRVKAKHR